VSTEDRKIRPGGGVVAAKIREQLGIGSVAKSVDDDEIAQSGGRSSEFQAALAQHRQQRTEPGSAPVGEVADLRKQIEGPYFPGEDEGETLEKAAPSTMGAQIGKAARGGDGEDALDAAADTLVAKAAEEVAGDSPDANPLHTLQQSLGKLLGGFEDQNGRKPLPSDTDFWDR
jgi:hypothetical protein